MIRSPDPPEEPQQRSEPTLLSPTSPKPLHFPQPTNIPILELQMDVGFNQTEAHMSDPAMHDTDVRPDMWRDPNEQPAPPVDHTSSPSGGNAMDVTATPSPPQDANPPHVDSAVGSVDAATHGHATQPFSPPSGSASDAASQLQTGVTPGAGAPATHESSDLNMSPTDLATMTDVPAPHADEINPDTSQPLAPVQGEVDVQALLDTLQSSIAPTASAGAAPTSGDVNAATTSSLSFTLPAQPLSSTEVTPVLTPGLGASSSGLPPRPPRQEQPLLHPDYVHSKHIRDYHPHAEHSAFQPHARTNSAGNIADPLSSAYVPPVPTTGSQQGEASGMNNNTLVAPATPSGASDRPPSLPSFPATNPSTSLAAGARSADDAPWTADVQSKYDHFMEEERRYVNEARWDQFPPGSRLFVGNLSSEKVTKRDIFHVFHSYGDLAQISIKQAYGFVQFLRMEDCARAMEAEQGRVIRDKRIHLEISKPQKSSRRNDNAGRRSRSPEYGGRNRHGGNVDRYVSGGGRSNGRGGGREEYRPYRSPSPRGYRERYDDRRRPRSRSPGHRGGGYGRQSPRRDDDDGLPLPHRHPHEVPDVQILAIGQLETDFIQWVEKAFSGRGFRVNTIRLSPVLDENAVIRRQIMEGVVAVSRLRRENQDRSKIGLTIFKRTSGTRDVQFEEYSDLDPSIAAELVNREKVTQSAPPSASSYSAYQGGGPGWAPPSQPPAPMQYGQPAAPTYAPAPSWQPPGYGFPSQGFAPAGAYPPNLNTSVNPNLQGLLGSLHNGSPQTPQTVQYPPPHAYGVPPTQPPTSGPPPQQYGYPPSQPPPSAAPPSNVAPPAPGSDAHPNVQAILARLGTYPSQ